MMNHGSMLLHSVSLVDDNSTLNKRRPVNQLPMSQENTLDEEDLDPTEFLSHDVATAIPRTNTRGSAGEASRQPSPTPIPESNIYNVNTANNTAGSGLGLGSGSGSESAGGSGGAVGTNASGTGTSAFARLKSIPTLSEHEFFLNPLVFSDKDSLGFVTVSNSRREESRSRQNTPGLPELKYKASTKDVNEEDGYNNEVDFLDSSNNHRKFTQSFSRLNSNTNLEPVNANMSESFENSMLDSFRLSSLLPQTSFDIQRIQDSPVEFLTNRGKVLEEEVSINLNSQKKSLELSEGNLNKIRTMILQDFEQMSGNFNMLAEAYTTELRYVSKMYDSFEAWNEKRDKLLWKVAYIKSSKSKYGSKLETLVVESDKVDDEINQLELKLASLRQRKQVLNNEIQNTSSILESRTLSYVETFRNLEREGELAIRSMLDLNGVDKISQDKFIKKSSIDVSFGGKRTNKETIHTTTDQPKGKLIPHSEDTDKNMNLEKENQLLDLPDDQPFRKGFTVGSMQTHKAKLKLAKVFNDLLSRYDVGINFSGTGYNSHHQTQKPQLDDYNNTISSKLDYEHIRTLLKLKISALEDVILNNVSNSNICNEYYIIWKDVKDSVLEMENSLFLLISNRTSETVLNSDTSRILSTSLDVLEERIEMLILKKENDERINGVRNSTIISLLLSAIFNEAEAIGKALSLVSRDDTLIHRLGSLKLRAGIAEFLSPSKPPSFRYNEPTGFLNKPINDYRSQAETELAGIAESSHKMPKSSFGYKNNKMDPINKDKKL